MFESIMNHLNVFILVMMRFTGMIFFNPLTGRKNVPMTFNMGLVLALTYFVFGFVQVPDTVYNTLVGMSFALLKELMVGIFIGYLVYAMLAVFLIAGEVIDMQLGISMSKMYDPQSNISMPISGSIFNAMFMILFFLSNAHLSLISAMVYSFEMVPPGAVVLTADMAIFAVNFFGAILTLALKLALPIVVVQLITEVAVGIIMKAIPQINVFVLSIQIKLLMGFAILFVLVPKFADFMDSMLQILLQNISNGIQLLFV